MKRSGKISSIKRAYNDALLKTIDSELSKNGLTRIPGTGVFKYPYKERDGKYRTGLDPQAAYIKRIADETEREVEIQRVTKLRDELQAELGLDLSPTSKFWNYALANNPQGTQHVEPVKLLDGDNIFDLTNSMMKLTYAWLRVHPTIASSYQAWERGEYPADTQFYVADDDIESEVTFKKKQLINKAIVKFDTMTPDKKRKIARVLGLPVDDNTKEETVYNLVDNVLKETEFKNGKHAGLNPVTVFHQYADMKESLLHIKDLVQQAVIHSVYRVKANGKVFEGELEVAVDQDELVKYLADEDNQEDLIMLEKKVKGKKLAKV